MASARLSLLFSVSLSLSHALCFFLLLDPLHPSCPHPFVHILLLLLLMLLLFLLAVCRKFHTLYNDDVDVDEAFTVPGHLGVWLWSSLYLDPPVPPVSTSRSLYFTSLFAYLISTPSSQSSSSMSSDWNSADFYEIAMFFVVISDQIWIFFGRSSLNTFPLFPFFSMLILLFALTTFF